MRSKGHFEFYSYPKFIAGRKAMEHIPVELDGFDAKRPMVVTSQRAADKGLVKKFITALEESNVVVAGLVDGVPDYVPLDLVERISGLFKMRECDSIIAIGGSGVMNFAKALNVTVSLDYNLKKGLSDIPFGSTLKPLFYVAAIEADGWECTNTAFIEGIPVTDDTLYPELVCIDKSMGLPYDPASFYYSAVESIAVCVEASASIDDNPMIDAFSFAAIQLINGNLPTLIKKPCNKAAALSVQNGIASAGVVRANSEKGIISLASEYLSKESGLSTGMISSALLPALVQYMIKTKTPVRDSLLLSLEGIPAYCAAPAKEKTAKILESLKKISSGPAKNSPAGLRAMKVQEHLIEKCALYVEEGSNKKISRKQAAEILSIAYTAAV